MKPKSKFETVHPGPYRVVLFSSINPELLTDQRDTETAAVMQAKKLLAAARVSARPLGAAIFPVLSDDHIGPLRRSWTRNAEGEITENENPKVIR